MPFMATLDKTSHTYLPPWTKHPCNFATLDKTSMQFCHPEELGNNSAGTLLYLYNVLQHGSIQLL